MDIANEGTTESYVIRIATSADAAERDVPSTLDGSVSPPEPTRNSFLSNLGHTPVSEAIEGMGLDTRVSCCPDGLVTDRRRRIKVLDCPYVMAAFAMDMVDHGVVRRVPSTG